MLFPWMPHRLKRIPHTAKPWSEYLGPFINIYVKAPYWRIKCRPISTEHSVRPQASIKFEFLQNPPKPQIQPWHSKKPKSRCCHLYTSGLKGTLGPGFGVPRTSMRRAPLPPSRSSSFGRATAWPPRAGPTSRSAAGVLYELPSVSRVIRIIVYWGVY